MTLHIIFSILIHKYVLDDSSFFISYEDDKTFYWNKHKWHDIHGICIDVKHK